MLCNRFVWCCDRWVCREEGGDKEGQGNGEGDGVGDGGWEALHPGVKDTAWKNIARRFMQDFQVRKINGMSHRLLSMVRRCF